MLCVLQSSCRLLTVGLACCSGHYAKTQPCKRNAVTQFNSACLAAGAAAALAAARAAGASARPLEMFFPFDPYLLRRSARLLDLEVRSHIRQLVQLHEPVIQHQISDR